MLMDVELLPTYKKALANDPEAILKIADAYNLGAGVPLNYDIAHTWYEKLLAFENLPYVEYEYCYILAATAAYTRKQYQLAYQRLNHSFKLFVKRFGRQNAFDKLNEVEFFDKYYRTKLLAEAWC